MSDAQTFLHTAVRWFDFVGLTTLLGVLAFRCLIVRPTLLPRQEFDSFERRRHWVEGGMIILVALTSVADLILRTLMMSGATPANLGSALPVVLRQTHYGAVWISRIALVGLLGVAWASGRRDLPWFAPSFLLAIFVALTTSLSGHAADWGDFALPVLIDWSHLLAVGAWIGGLFAFAFVLTPSLSPPAKEEPTHGLAAIAGRFSRMAACCATVFLVTGLYNAWLQVTSLSPLVTTSYGWTLLVKLSLVGMLLTIAGLNRYYFLPLLRHLLGTHPRSTAKTFGRLVPIPPPEKACQEVNRIRRQFLRFVRLEWGVAVAALACSALLTQLPPARHIRAHQHREEHAIRQPVPEATTAKSFLAER